jgi:integrase
MRILMEFVRELRDELIDKGRGPASKPYLSAARSLAKFAGDEDLLLKHITPDLMRRYRDYLIELGLTMTFISIRICMIRAIYDRALHRRIIRFRQEYPFKNLRICVCATKRNFLTQDELRALWRLLKDSGKLSDELLRALAYFMFCFHACGMPFVDMVFLKKTNVHGEHIIYIRKRTRQRMFITITDAMREIMAEFSTKSYDSPYLFPIIRPAERRERCQYEAAQTLLNRQLKFVGMAAGIEGIVSTYSARHSWAIVARDLNISADVIGKCLGHQDERETILFLASLER